MDDDKLELIHDDLVDAFGGYLAARRRRRRLVRIGAATFGIFVLTAAVAIAGAYILGGPAPDRVRTDIANVDRGMPADLRLNPDVEHAQAVAAAGTTTLFGAILRGGGYCIELVVADGPGRGAVCTTKTDLASNHLEVTVPTVVPDTGTPVALGGRVNVPAASLEIHYGESGQVDKIALAPDSYFAFEVPEERRSLALSSELRLVARDAKGKTVAVASVPADWNAPAAPDTAAPLYVSTRSDESDFTKVYGLEGHVSAAGAVSLDLDYGDGTHASIPIDPRGDFNYVVPPDRIGSFMTPRILTARDVSGQTVATAAVAAVAYWHGRDRHR
jgi:hypothetical protein